MHSPFKQAVEIDLSLHLPCLYFLESLAYINYRKENFPRKISIIARWFSLVFLITNRTEEGKLPLGYLQNLGQMLRDSRIDQAINPSYTKGGGGGVKSTPPKVFLDNFG